MSKYIYPKLPSAVATSPFVRLSGSGLANCLFVYARAIKLMHQREDCRLIKPTWFNISVGPYLRRASDKRHYLGLFCSKNEIGGIRKFFLLLFKRKDVITVEGLEGYFASILDDAEFISNYLIGQLKSGILKTVDSFDFSGCVAVHVRLGDYPVHVRTPIEWYDEEIKKYRATNSDARFLLFSDGKDEELIRLTDMSYVERASFGSAIADIIAISRCKFVIGSDSTFSGWGAYLGQVPCIFYRKHYGPVLSDQSKENVVSDEKLM